MRYGKDETAGRSGEDIRIVDLCFRYLTLRARGRAGEELSELEQTQLASLAELLEGDPQRQRRIFRRISLLILATLSARGLKANGVVLNLSCGGMFVSTEARVAPGTAVEVEIGSASRRSYVFPCVVERTERQGQSPGLGLRLTASPLARESYRAQQLS